MLTAITITQIYVPDQDQALDFYVGKLGFEVTNDMQFGPMRWLTVALPGRPDRQVLLEKPGPPSMSEETAAQVRDLISKGAAGGHLFFQCDDAYKTHAELKAQGRGDHRGAGRPALRHRLRPPRPVRQPPADRPDEAGLSRDGW